MRDLELEPESLRPGLSHPSIHHLEAVRSGQWMLPERGLAAADGVIPPRIYVGADTWVLRSHLGANYRTPVLRWSTRHEGSESAFEVVSGIQEAEWSA